MNRAEPNREDPRGLDDYVTHHERPSFTLADTTFRFLDANPRDAVEGRGGAGLHRGRDVANGRLDRLGRWVQRMAFSVVWPMWVSNCGACAKSFG